MKVAILSMQMVENYGSLLQAYGLKKIIESMGNEVEFMDIKRLEEDYRLLREEREYPNDDANASSKLIRLFNEGILQRILNKLAYKKFVNECGLFRNKYLEIDKKSSHYDLCVIGADEVFNCLQDSPWGYSSMLYGNIQNTNTIITYAASCGETSYEDVPDKVVESIKKSFNNISGFSVRDENTYQFVKKFDINNITYNLDPVLIYDYDNELNCSKLPKLPTKYCVIYSYGYRFNKKEEVNEILNFCKKHGLTPIALHGVQTWCKSIVATPFQCLKIIENSDFVITDTFHGTIFSIKYAKKFAIKTRNTNINKLSDLVARLGVQRHLIDDMSKLEACYILKKEYETINAVVELERERTLNYLRNYI